MNNEQFFIQFYKDQPILFRADLFSRVKQIASLFVDKPYAFEPLGEGEEGRYSTLPLYRADHFDCVTYVDTVLAMAMSVNFDEFKKNILQIRYVGSKVDYTRRTDWFTDLEWNPNMRRLGFIQDVTANMVDKNKKPVAETACAIINKPAWYAKKVLANIVVAGLSAEEATQRLAELQAEGRQFIAQESKLTFVPLKTLFDDHGQIQSAIWNQLPDVAVIEMVRPNWRPVNRQDNSTDYGTNLNVSHIGLAIRQEGEMFFYHASIAGKVMSGLLSDYLHVFLEDKREIPVAGVHVEKVIE